MKKLDLKSLSGLMIGILSLAIVASVTSCGSPESKYEDACILIGEMKFEEAKTLLMEIEPSKLEKGSASSALVLCDAGLLMKAGKASEAWEKMSSTTEDGSSYIVNIPSDDPLYGPATNIALWIKTVGNESYIQSCLDEDPETEEYGGNFDNDYSPKQLAQEVLEESMPEYSEQDKVIEVDGAKPRIMYASFGNVQILDGFKGVLEPFKDKYAEYLDELVAQESKYRAWEEQFSKLSQPPVYVISGLPLSWDVMPKEWVSTGLSGVGSGDVVELSGRIKKGSTTDDSFWLSSGHESTWATFWVEMASAYKSRICSMPEGSYVRVKAIYDHSETRGNSYYGYQSIGYYFKSAIISE